MQARSNDASAFTLVEILVVVAILGIAAAMVIPQLGDRSGLRVAAGARVLMADLMYAQNRAIATQRPHYIRFEPDQQRYTLYDDAAMTTPLEHPVEKLAYVAQFGNAGSMGVPDVTLVSAAFAGGQVLVFDVLGAPCVPGGSGSTEELLTEGEIVLRSGGSEMVVRVQPFTGEVQTQ